MADKTFRAQFVGRLDQLSPVAVSAAVVWLVNGVPQVSGPVSGTNRDNVEQVLTVANGDTVSLQITLTAGSGDAATYSMQTTASVVVVANPPPNPFGTLTQLD